MTKLVPGKVHNHPAYARWGKDKVSIAFPGEGRRAWQGAAIAATLPLIAVNPAFAGMGVLIPVAWSRFLRRRTAPEVVLLPSRMSIHQGGTTRSVERSALQLAVARRVEGSWTLVLETDQGTVTLQECGVPPAELQWTAELIDAWRDGLAQAPSRREWHEADDLGEQVLVGRPPIRGAEQALFMWILVLLLGIFGVALATVADGFDAGAIAAIPVMAVLGHFLGARIDGRSEVLLHPQSVRITTTYPRQTRRSIALEDLGWVEATAHRARLVLRSGEVVDVWIKDRGVELARAIEARRKALPAPSPQTRSELEARRAVQRLARGAATS